MNRITRVMLLSAGTLTLLACGLSLSPLSGVQDLASTAQAFATAIPSSIPGLPDVSAYMKPQGRPATDWKGIPIMSQATAGQEFEGGVYSFKVGQVSQADVQAFYEDQLPGLGWTSTFHAGAGSEGGVMIFTKDQSVLTIALGKSDSETLVILSMP
jgi:hypothetical protein